MARLSKRTIDNLTPTSPKKTMWDDSPVGLGIRKRKMKALSNKFDCLVNALNLNMSCGFHFFPELTTSLHQHFVGQVSPRKTNCCSAKDVIGLSLGWEGKAENNPKVQQLSFSSIH